MTYLTCSVAGLQGWCDRFIANSQDEILFASFFGGNEAVKGIMSAFHLGRELEILNGEKVGKFVKHKLNMNYLSTAVADNTTHCLTCVPTLFAINEYRNTCVLIGKNENDICEQAYKILMAKGQTPLIPEWKDIVMETIYVNRLQCYGIKYAAEIGFPEQETLERHMLDHINDIRMVTPRQHVGLLQAA